MPSPGGAAVAAAWGTPPASPAAAALQALTAAGLLPRPFTCDAANVTYEHRVDNPDDFNWCPVPGGGADALLFIGVAVLVSAALYHKFSPVWTLLAGAAFAALSDAFNLGHLSNALTIWLGIKPASLFFFLFLPPLLLDSAVRIDYFLFKRLAVTVLVFAFANVVLGAFALVPFLQSGLGLAAEGWRPIDAALFASMISATDAVAVSAILKAGGAPELLGVLLEGESLFNDASSIVLFEIFLRLSAEGGAPEAAAAGHAGTLSFLGHMLSEIARLAGVGAIIGKAMGYATQGLLALLQRRPAPPAVEVAVTLGGGYMAYLLTEFYGLFGHLGSGVIGVVVYALHGSATLLWGLSAKGRRSNSFFAFWDVVQFIANGLVFFFVGASVVNFFARVHPALHAVTSPDSWDLLYTLGSMLVRRVVPISLATLTLRGALMAAEAPLLALVGPTLSWRDIVFSTVGGLRGGLALILAQTVLTAHHTSSGHQQHVRAQMVLWTAGVVLLSLVVYAPLLVPLMNALGLNKPTAAKRHMHKRARAAVAAYTRQALEDLREDDDELLRGVDWGRVADAADMSRQVDEVFRATAVSDDSDTDDDSIAGGIIPAAAGPFGAASALLQPLLGNGRSSSTGPRSGLLSGLLPSGASRTSAAQRSSFLMFRSRSGASGGGGGSGRRSLRRSQSGDEETGAAGSRGRRGAEPAEKERSGDEAFIAARISAQDRALQAHADEPGGCPFTGPSPRQSDAAGGALSGAAAPPTQTGTGGADGGDDGADGGAAAAAPVPAAAVGEDGVPAAAAAAVGDNERHERAEGLGGGRPGAGLAPGAPRRAPRHALQMSPLVAARWEGATRGPSPAPAAAAGGPQPSLPLARHPSPARNGSGGSGGGGASGGGQPPPPPLGRVSVDPLQSRSRQVPGSFVWRAAGRQDMSAARRMPLRDEEEFTVESRLSLLAGFKRHFRFKAAEGLLSTQGLRLLEYACDCAASRPELPVQLWAHVGREVVSRHGATPLLAALLLRLRGLQARALRQARAGGGALVLLQAPLAWCSRKIRNQLSWAAMAALEVALELWLALTASPQARWTAFGTSRTSAMLHAELQAQAAVVWAFIADRAAEAPDEFSAIQTHRATLAIIRRQLAFVEQLGRLGAIEAEEVEELGGLLERKLAHLERRGPRWRPPSVTEVLSSLPCLASASPDIIAWLRAYGEIRACVPGEAIAAGPAGGGAAASIVLSGLVRVVAGGGGEDAGGEGEFLGIGSIFGLHQALLGRSVPGTETTTAYAQGNALGRGPVLLQLPLRIFAAARARAGAGQSEYKSLLNGLYRTAGLEAWESLKPATVRALTAHLNAAVAALNDAAAAAAAAEEESGGGGGRDGHAMRQLRRTLAALLAPGVPSEAAAGATDVIRGGVGGVEAGANPIDPAAASGGAAVAAALLAAAGLAGGGEGGDEDDTIARLVAERALAAAENFEDTLATADVLSLSPGDPWSQTSSALLLDGSLTPAGADAATATLQGLPGGLASSSSVGGASGGGGAPVSVPRLAAPVALAWAPEFFEPLAVRRGYRGVRLVFKAGPRGALLLVTPSDMSSGTSDDGGGRAGGSDGSGLSDEGGP